MNVAVIGGNGVVGRALINSFKHNVNVEIVDPTVKTPLEYKSVFDLSNKVVTECTHYYDYIFITVPTPTTGHENFEHDNSLIKYYLTMINEFTESFENFNPVVVINSTTIYNFSKDYTKLNILYNPEFIQDVTALDDFINTPSIVIGGNDPTIIKTLEYFYKNHTNVKTDDFIIGTVDDVIHFKYIRNLKQAWNLMFWELTQDITFDSLKMKSMMDKMPVKENHIIGYGGYRGFGGKCLPKDIKALTTLDKINTYAKDMLKALLKYNSRLL